MGEGVYFIHLRWVAYIPQEYFIEIALAPLAVL